MAMNKTIQISSPCQLRPNTTALIIKPETKHLHTFHKFFDCWLNDLNSNLEHFVSAANHHRNETNIKNDAVLRLLITNTVNHYENYYKAKSDRAKVDVISMFTPTWLTTLELAFLWIADWRPTMIIHLLYSKSGIQLEARLNDLIPESNFEDLGDMSFNQMKRIDELQKKTIREERIISERMATVQESAADTLMVDLSNAVSEMIRKDQDGNGNGWRENSDCVWRVESVMETTKDELEEVLHVADGLRMETLRSVFEILTPLQAVYFLIAAAELNLQLHDWGKKRDAK